MKALNPITYHLDIFAYLCVTMDFSYILALAMRVLGV
jgi:hypothetical protein